MEILKKFWMLGLIVVLFGIVIYQQIALLQIKERMQVVVNVLDTQGAYIIRIVQTPEVVRTLQELSK